MTRNIHARPAILIGIGGVLVPDHLGEAAAAWSERLRAVMASARAARVTEALGPRAVSLLPRGRRA
jgi:hypothetical protein